VAESTVRFPVGILAPSAPAVAVGVENVILGHAHSLVRAGYPVRLVTGMGGEGGGDLVVRTVGELSRVHPRVAPFRDPAHRAENASEFEECVQDLAQAIGRELVGCGSVFVYDLLTSDANPPAAEAIWRLAQGSRGVVAHGAPTRRWILFAYDPPCVGPKGAGKKKAAPATDKASTRMPGASYAAPSAARQTALCNALKLKKSEVRVVPGGVDAVAFLGLTENVAGLASETDLAGAEFVMLTPARILERKAISRGLRIVKAMTRGRKKRVVWLITAPQDAQIPESRRAQDHIMVEREKLGLRDEVRILSRDDAWAKPRLREADLHSLYRLCDVLFLPSEDAAFGASAIEGALARQVLVLGPAPALGELVSGKGGAVRLAKSETAAAAAKKITKAVESSGAWRLRRRVMAELSWDAICTNHLIPLIEGA
jgi:glycosyltransferase involved in cell wall biosynthesis